MERLVLIIILCTSFLVGVAYADTYGLNQLEKVRMSYGIEEIRQPDYKYAEVVIAGNGKTVYSFGYLGNEYKRESVIKQDLVKKFATLYSRLDFFNINEKKLIEGPIVKNGHIIQKDTKWKEISYVGNITLTYTFADKSREIKYRYSHNPLVNELESNYWRYIRQENVLIFLEGYLEGKLGLADQEKFESFNGNLADVLYLEPEKVWAVYKQFIQKLDLDELKKFNDGELEEPPLAIILGNLEENLIPKPIELVPELIRTLSLLKKSEEENAKIDFHDYHVETTLECLWRISGKYEYGPDPQIWSDWLNKQGEYVREIEKPGLKEIKQALRSTDPYVRIRAAHQLAQIKTPEAISLLERCLKDKDIGVRCTTIDPLASYGAKKGKIPSSLIALLLEKDPKIRLVVIKAIANYFKKSASSILIDQFKSDSENCREIAYILAELRITEAVPELTRIIEEDPYANRGIITSLGMMEERAVPFLTKLLKDHPYSKVLAFPPSVPRAEIERQIQKNTDNLWVVEDTIEALGLTKSPEAVEPLVTYLDLFRDQQDWQLCEMIVESLTQINSPAALPALQKIVEDDTSVMLHGRVDEFLTEQKYHLIEKTKQAIEKIKEK